MNERRRFMGENDSKNRGTFCYDGRTIQQNMDREALSPTVLTVQEETEPFSLDHPAGRGGHGSKRGRALTLYPESAPFQEEKSALRVAAYIRVSTDNCDQKDSYEAQQQYFMEFLTEHPMWRSAGIYADYGISGTTRERRRGFNRLLRHCEEGRIDRIVTRSISRFARNTRDFLRALAILKEYHVTIVFEKEQIDTAIVQSDLMITAFGALAQEESQSIAANVRKGIRYRFPRGEMRNVVIYGYRYAAGEDATERMESGYTRRRVEIVEEEAAIVKRIYMEAAEGRGYTEIARGLNTDAVPGPRTPVSILRSKQDETPAGTLNPGLDEGWTARHVKQILMLERYCGDALLQKTFTPDYKTHKSVWNYGELPRYYIEDNHPAIISRELFAAVQKLLNQRSFRGEKRPVYPFSGRIVCTQCGRFYVTRNRKARPVWSCGSTGRNTGKVICRAARIYEDRLISVCRRAAAKRFGVIAEKTCKKERTEEEGIRAEWFGKEHIRTGYAGTGDSGKERLIPDDPIYTGIDWSFVTDGGDPVRELLRRMERIHLADEMERDLTFLKQQIAAVEDEIEKERKNGEMMRPEEGAAYLTEPSACTAKRLQIAQEKQKRLLRQKDKLERFWNDLEADYELRREAIAWMKTLPDGKAGMEELLIGLTGRYLKAFILRIEVISPSEYRIRWFDDTWTATETDSSEELGYI